MRPTAALVLSSVLAVVLGCGYRVVPYAPGAPRQTVVVEGLRNDSFEPGLEFLVGDALRREFLRRGALEMVGDSSRADWVLEGVVLPVRSRSESFSSVNFALEYELTLELRLIARAPDGEKRGFDARVVSGSEFYLASADVEVSRKNRVEALRRVATLIAGRVHDALVEAAPR